MTFGKLLLFGNVGTLVFGAFNDEAGRQPVEAFNGLRSVRARIKHVRTMCRS